jgi:hypothetical protein
VRAGAYVTLGVSALLLAGMAYLTLAHGPSRRVMAAERRCAGVVSSEEILEAWRSAGVRGRVAVLFSRRLNGDPGPGDPAGIRYLEDAMQHGLVREAHHLVPDGAWAEVEGNLSRMFGARPMPGGFVLPFGAGRVYVLPLSRFAPVPERALVVLAPGDWSASDQAAVVGLLGSGQVSADLLSVLRGRPEEVRTLCEAAAAKPAGP